MKNILFYIVLLSVVGSSVYGADDFETKIKNVEKQRKQREKVILNNNLRREMDDFLLKNESVSSKDFKKLRMAGYTSLITIEDLGKRYGVKNDDYQAKIKDEHEKKIYKIADKLWRKYHYREFYACKNDDEIAAMESKKKVDSIRTSIAAILKKDRKERHSDKIIKLKEQILDECRFEDASLSLLGSYRIRGMRDKFNNLMLRIIEDDQTNYDYLHSGVDDINTSFILSYLEFLKDVNGRQHKLILSKEQVKTIAESLLTKHQEVFNLHNAPYYSAENGAYIENFVYQGVQSLVNVSMWLREYKLDDLNDRFIERYFRDEMVISTLRDDPWFKDFWNYLLQRQEFEKYR